MKKLSELYDVNSDVLIKDVKINSKEVEENDIFVCTMGVTCDRHDFIDEAIEKGASAIVVSRDIENKKVPIIKVKDTNKELINLSRKLYDFKDSDLELIGITGTNGKTTVALMTKYLIGNTCGYIGTNGLISKNINQSIRNTTPDADRLYKYFKMFKDDGCQTLCMETSSEAFYRNRLDTLKFKVGVITNITEDHLNIHKTLENYVSCKLELLNKIDNDGIVILNTDDKYYELAKSKVKNKLMTFGKDESATMQLISIEETTNGSTITINYENKEYTFKSPYLGEINAYNVMASLLIGISFGYNIEELIDKVKNLPKIPGRLDIIYNDKYTVMLDYAHTTDAFEKILPILNRIKKNRLITITGSAGGRETEKRGPMGKYVLENSDYVIFTMDDPRYESVDKIIDDLINLSKNTNYERIINRKEAIRKAIDIAQEGDIILVAGKGIDNYMAIDDKYLPYSDLDVIKDILNIK